MNKPQQLVQDQLCGAVLPDPREDEQGGSRDEPPTTPLRTIPGKGWNMTTMLKRLGETQLRIESLPPNSAQAATARAEKTEIVKWINLLAAAQDMVNEDQARGPENRLLSN
jgi:hypothetical protein